MAKEEKKNHEEIARKKKYDEGLKLAEKWKLIAHKKLNEELKYCQGWIKFQIQTADIYTTVYSDAK